MSGPIPPVPPRPRPPVPPRSQGPVSARPQPPAPPRTQPPGPPRTSDEDPPEWFRQAARRPLPPGGLHPALTRPAPRPAQPPWIGASQPAFYPGVEDATMLIQRITDEAVPDAVFEGTGDSTPTQALTAEATRPITTDDAAAGMKTARTSGVLKAGALMAVATVVSRVTGLVAKVAIAAIIGGSVVNSSYSLANTLPNIVFELLIGGVLTSVAIPLLTRAQRSDSDGGAEYTQRLLTLAVVGLALATAVAIAAAPLLTRLYLSPGSEVDPRLATEFAVLLLPQIFFYGIAALFGAILNTKERFAANAWAPVLNNLVVIAVAILLAAGHFGQLSPDEISTRNLQILGVGTTAGIVLQALVMIPSLRRAGFRWKWRWGWDRRFTEASGLLGWATVYVLISQAGVTITLRVASGNSGGGIFFFQTASLIFQMPYGILGVAVLTAIMPRMSRHAAAGQMADVKSDMSLANRLSAVALLPVSAGLIVLGAPLTVVIYEFGKVRLDAALTIGGILAGLAVGLVPLAMTLVQMRVFYAMKDGRTPTIINAIMVAVRIPLMLLSAHVLGEGSVIAGVAVSTAISYVVGAIVGEIWLRVRFGPMGTLRTLTTIGKMLVASAVGGIAAFVVADRTVGIIPDGYLDAARICVVAGVTGLVVIAIMALLLRVEELLPLRNRILRVAGLRPPVVAAGPAVPERANSSPKATDGAARRPSMEGSARVTSPTGRPPGISRAPGAPSSSREQVTVLVSSTPGGPTGSPASDDPTVQVRRAGDSEPTVIVGAGGPGSDSRGSDSRGSDSRGSDTVNVGGPPAVSTLTPVVLGPGSTVGGRYRLVNLVAADSAGNRFWRAKDTVLPRDMAVTLLPDTNAASATVARTLRVGRLHHIGLPQTLDVGSEHGQSYVVGQWVDGATLTDLLSGGPLEPDVATSITAKVSESVAEAHRNGIALGAINPSLVRVNFDGQVRLSHVIAHGSATPDQDIRAVGALLYLMLTGTWPLSNGSTESASETTARHAAADQTVRLGSTDAALPPAPTRLGREVPADEIRAGIPEALSALAERALHPEDADGIHAVGAIAALLRQPEVVAVSSAPPVGPVQSRPALSPAERRLVKERRIKLAIAFVMLAVFAGLIVIVVASLSKQFLSSIQDPTAGEGPLPVSTTTAPTTSAPTTIKSTSRATSPSATASSRTSATTTLPPAIPAVPLKIDDATVYDPEGVGDKDNTGKVGRAFDGDAGSSWDTFIYNQQFPTTKLGVGLTLELDKVSTPTSIEISSDTPVTKVEIRSASAPDAPLASTKVLGSGTINGAPVTIKLANAPASKYLIVFVTQLAPSGNKFQSDINEINVSGH